MSGQCHCVILQTKFFNQQKSRNQSYNSNLPKLFPHGAERTTRNSLVTAFLRSQDSVTCHVSRDAVPVHNSVFAHDARLCRISGAAPSLSAWHLISGAGGCHDCHAAAGPAQVPHMTVMSLTQQISFHSARDPGPTPSSRRTLDPAPSFLRPHHKECRWHINSK